jgi:hypothetical protein
MFRSPIVRFAARAALFVALQAAIAAALLPLAARRGQEGVLAVVRDKHARLRAARGRPRLFIAAGSSGSFGFDSTAIERATGRETTNLAIHAGLGMPYIVAEAESAAGPGDEVWLAPEFNFLWQEPSLTEELWALLCARPAGVRDLRYVPVKTLLDHGPFQFLGHVARRAWQWARSGVERSRGMYVRSSFDERGDFVGHVGREPVRPLTDMSLGDVPLPEATLRAGLAVLERGVRGCEARGATVRIVLPPLHEELVRSARPDLERIVAELERRFPGKVVGTLDDVAVPDAWCFDTGHHLVREAARERTRQLLAGLGHAPAAAPDDGAAEDRERESEARR